MYPLPVETQPACCPPRLMSVSSYGQRVASFSSSSSLFSSLHLPGWSGPQVDGQLVYSSSSHNNMLVTRQWAQGVKLHLACVKDLSTSARHWEMIINSLDISFFFFILYRQSVSTEDVSCLEWYPNTGPKRKCKKKKKLSVAITLHQFLNPNTAVQHQVNISTNCYFG